MDEQPKTDEVNAGPPRFTQIEKKLFTLQEEGGSISCLKNLDQDEIVGLFAMTFNVARGSINAQSLAFRYVGRIFGSNNLNEIKTSFQEAYNTLDDYNRLAILGRAPKNDIHDLANALVAMNEEVVASLEAIGAQQSVTSAHLDFLVARARNGSPSTLADLTAIAAYSGCYSLQGGFQERPEAYRNSLIQRGKDLIEASTQSASATSF